VRLAAAVEAFTLPVIATTVWAVTVTCETVNVAVVFPEATITVTGTVATFVFALVSVIVKPAVGAGPLIVTVPVTLVVELPLTVEGLSERLSKTGALTVRVPDWELEPIAPVIVATVSVATAIVGMLNLAFVEPTATETLAGGVAAFDDEVKVTLIAPLLLPGTALRVTVPPEAVPPLTEEGEIATLETRNGFTSKTTVLETPLNVAVIEVDAVVDTDKWVTENVAVVAPDAIFTEEGIVAAFVSELVKVTTSPAGAAEELRVTVPVTVTFEPPTTLVEERPTPCNEAGLIVRVVV